jgi:Glycosyl transferase family 2
MVDVTQATDTRVWIVSASGQNVFFAEMLEAIGSTLAAAGLQIEHSSDRFPPWRKGDVYLFVPHEYVPFVEKQAHPGPLQLSRTVAICTEQPGTHWFEESAAIASRAAAAVDINVLGVRELRRRGIETDLLQLGYYRPWDTWAGQQDNERPVDVTFMGGYTERRAKVLARCARYLVNRRAELILTESLRPHLEHSTHFLSGERRWAALRRAKVIVNVHRNELGYLEWLRVIGAMLSGCVVLTEHSIGYEPLVPGEHFVSVGYDRLPLALDALLAEPCRIVEIRDAAYRFLRSELPLLSTITPLVECIAKLAAEPARDLPIAAPVRPSPREPASPATPYERLFGERTDLNRLTAVAKTLALGQMDLRRDVSRLSKELSSNGSLPREPVDEIEHRGERERPVRVSVLLSVYNYAHVVQRAIASVAASEFTHHELIVVDDCSEDESLACIRAELDSHPGLPATIVARGRNYGLASARNCAVQHARGELVFILDADNEIYPHALARLASALEQAPSASFAYGIIERFGPTGPIDLMSWQEWDPERLRYGNYVDAMAMIRRDRILETGGYTSDRRLYGWEDFALWCEFASRGLNGVRVPEILTRYRANPQSMISTTNIDTSAAWTALLERNHLLLATGS